jgi:hypothetical protein
MRPCNNCGAPVENSDLFCARCMPRRDSDTKQLEASTSNNDTNGQTDASITTDHWLLVFIGNFLYGIPAALFITIGSQIVTSFQMDTSFSCKMGLFVLCMYGIGGGVGDLLSFGGRRIKLAFAGVLIIWTGCFVWWWFDTWRSLPQADAAWDTGTLLSRELSTTQWPNKRMNRSELDLASFVAPHKFNPTFRPVILNVRPLS